MGNKRKTRDHTFVIEQLVIPNPDITNYEWVISRWIMKIEEALNKQPQFLDGIARKIVDPDYKVRKHPNGLLIRFKIQFHFSKHARELLAIIRSAIEQKWTDEELTVNIHQ